MIVPAIFRKTEAAANVFFLYAPFMKMRLSRSTERDNREIQNILSAEYGYSTAEAILNCQAKKPLHIDFACSGFFVFLYPNRAQKASRTAASRPRGMGMRAPLRIRTSPGDSSCTASRLTT